MTLLNSSSRSLRLFLALAAVLVGSVAPAAAQFVTVSTAIPGQATAIAVADRIYVAGENSPTVEVFDSQTLLNVATVSLLAFDTVYQPAGVTALAVAADGTILVGTTPHGGLFGIRDLSGFRIARSPALRNTDTLTRISTLHVEPGGAVSMGGVSWRPGSPQSVFRGVFSGTSWSPARIDFPDSRVEVIHAIAGRDSLLAFATADSPALGTARRGRLWLYNVRTAGISEVWSGDSEVTALTWWRTPGRDTLLAAGSPSGIIRDSLGNTVADLPETVVHVMTEIDSGGETVVWIGAQSGTLRRLGRDNVTVLGIPVAGLTSIRGIAQAKDPERVWMTGRGPGNVSSLFYYDSTPPRVQSVSWTIDTGLRQPFTSDTFAPPLTTGRYFVRIRTHERLSAAPTLQIEYADSGAQPIALSGSGRDWSAEIVIDSHRPGGRVTVLFSGVDDAGNVGREILSGGSFLLRSYGRVALANNFIRPNLGEFTTVRYVLTSSENVTVRVYNLRGRLVADLSPGVRGPGEHRDVVWRGRNTEGNLVASGVYLLRFEAGESVKATQKIMVVR